MTPTRSVLRRLRIGVLASGCFFLTACAEGAVRPDFDPWQQSISALALGPGGWVQTLAFVVLGLVVVWTAPAWRELLRGGVGRKAVPALIAITGVALLLAAVFPQDPAPGYDPMRLELTRPTLTGLLHLLVAAIGAGCTIAALFVLARRFRGDPAWRGWSVGTSLTALLMIACIAIYAVWSTSASGYAGAFERAGMLVMPVWTAVFLRRLTTGVPLPRMADG